MKSVVIFGGSGFVGQNILYCLAKKGFRIIVPYQKPINEAKLRLFGNVGQIVPIKFKNLKEEIIRNIIKDSDVLINLKTIWNEKKILTYKNNIFNFNLQLIDLINSVDRNKVFVFLSGLGVSENSLSIRSQYIAKVEKYISQNLINSSIIRPSFIIGEKDQFIRKLMPIFKFSFFIPLFGSGNTKLQPVYVGDISKAIENLVVNKIRGKNIYELVGPETFTYKNFYQFIAKCLNVKRIFVKIPFNLVKIIVFLIEKTPFNIMTVDQLLLFKEDNTIENIDKNFNDLAINPKDIKEVIKKILKN